MKAGTWGGGDSSAASALPSDGRRRFEARRNRLLLFITITFSVEVSLCRVVGRPLETISVRQLETHPEVVKRRKVCFSEEAVWNHSAAARPFSQGRMGVRSRLCRRRLALTDPRPACPYSELYSPPLFPVPPLSRSSDASCGLEKLMMMMMMMEWCS